MLSRPIKRLSKFPGAPLFCSPPSSGLFSLLFSLSLGATNPRRYSRPFIQTANVSEVNKRQGAPSGPRRAITECSRYLRHTRIPNLYGPSITRALRLFVSPLFCAFLPRFCIASHTRDMSPFTFEVSLRLGTCVFIFYFTLHFQ